MHGWRAAAPLCASSKIGGWKWRSLLRLGLLRVSLLLSARPLPLPAAPAANSPANIACVLLAFFTKQLFNTAAIDALVGVCVLHT